MQCCTLLEPGSSSPCTSGVEKCAKQITSLQHNTLTCHETVDRCSKQLEQNPKVDLCKYLLESGLVFVIDSNFQLSSFVLLQSVPLPWYFNDIMLCSFFALMGLLFFSLNSPDVFRVAGKFDLLDRILPKLKRTNHRCDITVLPLLRHIFIVNFSLLLLLLLLSVAVHLIHMSCIPPVL